jgi:hypothetical protein
MTTPIEVYRYLLMMNNPYLFDCRQDARCAKQFYDKGETPPDRLLPGGAVRALTPEQREILSKLTSEEVEKERY